MVFRPSREFDFLSIAFVSQQIYFSPMIFQAFGFCGGYGCYLYKVSIIGMVLVFVIAFFSMLSQRERARRIVIRPEPRAGVFLFFCMALSLLGLFLLVLKSGGKVFFLPKREIMKFISYDYIVWVFSATVGMVFSVRTRSNKWLVFFLLLLLVSFYIGFRSPLAISFIASLVIVSQREGLNLRRIGLRYFLLIILIGLAFFLYKGFYSAIKMGNYDVLKDRIFSLDYYLFIFQSSEPVVNLSILSNVVESDLYIGPSDLLRILTIATLFMEELFQGFGNFNSVIQPLFYSDISGGVGSNIWAYWYAVAGWGGLLFFIFFYGFSLWWLSWLHRSSGLYVSSLVAYLGAYWAFYIHRNDLIYQLSLERRVLIIFSLIYLVSVLFSNITNRKGRSYGFN